MGSLGASVGPPLVVAMRRAFGADTVAVKGIRNIRTPTRLLSRHNGKQHGDQNAGSKKMLDLAVKTRADCPQSKIVLAGYRQGAEKVHGALAGMPKDMNVAVRTSLNFDKNKF
jgi:cutinase